jgi:cyclopropane fatty-acyl-phospholipid synthase-like methyltransferase
LRALRGAGYSDVHGVDLSPQSADLARKAGFQVTQADLQEFLIKSDEYFDLITAFDVIEHFGKDEVFDVLGFIWKRMKPGGVLILQTPNALSPWASSMRYGDMTHEVIYSPNCIATLLRMTGFTKIETREVWPCIHSLKGFLLWPLRRAVWLGYAAWNLAEEGSLLGGIYTRNMLIRATKELE